MRRWRWCRCSFVLTGASLAIAQDEEALRSGTPLNSAGFANPARDFLSAGRYWFSTRRSRRRLSEPDPYFSAAAGSGGQPRRAPSRCRSAIRRPHSAGTCSSPATSAIRRSRPSRTSRSIPPIPITWSWRPIDYNMGSTMSMYVSFDGGETWEGPNQIRYFRDDISGAGDPVVAFDRDGNVYISMFSIGVREFQIGSIASRRR